MIVKAWIPLMRIVINARAHSTSRIRRLRYRLRPDLAWAREMKISAPEAAIYGLLSHTAALW